MNKNEEQRKCKKCGKTIVGKNKLGLCSACKKENEEKGVIIGTVIVTVVTAALGFVAKLFNKKE